MLEARMVDTFVVAFHDGCWRIGYDGHWYGIYPDERSARRVAMLVASAHPELPTQVAVVRAGQKGSHGVHRRPHRLDGNQP